MADDGAQKPFKPRRLVLDGGHEVRIAIPGSTEDEIFIDISPMSITVHVGEAARIARETKLAQYRKAMPPSAQPIAAPRRAALAPPDPSRRVIPPPVIETPAEEARRLRDEVADLDAEVSDERQQVDRRLYEDPSNAVVVEPQNAGHRVVVEPKSPIDRTGAWKNALVHTVSIAGKAVTVDLTDMRN